MSHWQTIASMVLELDSGQRISQEDTELLLKSRRVFAGSTHTIAMTRAHPGTLVPFVFRAATQQTRRLGVVSRRVVSAERTASKHFTTVRSTGIELVALLILAIDSQSKSVIVNTSSTEQTRLNDDWFEVSSERRYG